MRFIHSFPRAQGHRIDLGASFIACKGLAGKPLHPHPQLPKYPTECPKVPQSHSIISLNSAAPTQPRQAWSCLPRTLLK